MRAASLALRVLSMASQFVATIVVLAGVSATVAAQFVVVMTAVPLVITVAGLEAHTYSDREILAGLHPREAVRNLFRIEAISLVLVSGTLIPLHRELGLSFREAALLAGACAAALGTQEYFRILVVLGRQQSANLLLTFRNVLPFALVISAVAVGKYSTTLLLCLMTFGSIAGILYGRHELRLHAAPGSRPTAPFDYRQCLSRALLFFPIAVFARVLLAIDILILPSTGATSTTIAAYGACLAGINALIAISDVAVLQWRTGAILRGTSGPELKRGAIEVGALGFAGAAVVFLLGATYVHRITGSSDSELWFYVIVLSLSAPLVPLVQYLQLIAYAARADRVLTKVYGCGFLVLSIGLGLSRVLEQPLLTPIARIEAWLLILSLLLYARPWARRGDL